MSPWCEKARQRPLGVGQLVITRPYWLSVLLPHTTRQTCLPFTTNGRTCKKRKNQHQRTFWLKNLAPKMRKSNSRHNSRTTYETIKSDIIFVFCKICAHIHCANNTTIEPGTEAVLILCPQRPKRCKKTKNQDQERNPANFHKLHRTRWMPFCRPYLETQI